MKKILNILVFVLIAGFMQAQQLDRSVRPSAAPAKEIHIKDAKTFTLSNGLKVFVVEDKRTPTVYYALSLDIKPDMEGDKAGMQDLFSAVFGTATKKRSKEQLNKDLDMIAARGNSSSRGGSMSVLKKYEDKALEIMADMLLNPVFLQSELDLNLERSKSNLASISDDAGAMTMRVSRALTYGKNYPSGEMESVQTMENVKIKDLETFYTTYFAPNVARLVIIGDITEDQAKANVQKYFGQWKKKNVPVAGYTMPLEPAETQVAIIEKSGAVQSAIDVSYPVNYKIDAPDQMAASVMSYILGGGSSARLFQNLRETHSYTYGVYGLLSSGELVGRFYLTDGRGGAASVKAENTADAINEIRYEMNKIVNAPVEDKELKDAKAYLAGSFGRSLENASTIANFALNIDKYNLPKDYYKTYLQRLEALTVQDIQAAAKKYIRPDNAYIVVSCDKAQTADLKQFAKNGQVQFYDENANPVEASVTKTADISPEELINKHVNARGGKEAIDKIQDFKMVMNMTMMGQPIEVIQLFKRPNWTTMIMNMGGNLMQKIVFDGKTMKVSGMGGSQELTEGAELELKKNSDPIVPEMDFAKNGYELKINGVEQLDGKDVIVMEVKKDAFTQVFYFDATTYLVMKSTSTQETPQGPAQQIIEYGDYRKVNEVMFAFKMKQSVSGMVMDFTTASMEINTGLDNKLFE